MTDREINIAIAEACGWEHCHVRQGKVVGYAPCEPRKVQGPHGPAVSNTEPFTSEPQDYCHNLNAMHEAEKTLPALHWDRYTQWLRELTKSNRRFLIAHADARQRAEAFLRTIGKWKEQP